MYTNEMGQTLTGDLLSNSPGAMGSIFPFEGITDSSGKLTERGKSTPATWRITSLNGDCSNSDPFALEPFYKEILFQPSSALQDDKCVRFAFGMSANPSVMKSSTTQATVTGNMNGRRPVTWSAYDSNGNLFASGSIGGVTASSCVCLMSFDPSLPSTSSLTAYMLDSSGEGVGTFHFSYTGTVSGGGGGGGPRPLANAPPAGR